jgi:hypothetical protein
MRLPHPLYPLPQWGRGEIKRGIAPLGHPGEDVQNKKEGIREASPPWYILPPLL